MQGMLKINIINLKQTIVLQVYFIHIFIRYNRLSIFLFMPVLPQTFFALVGSHFMSLSLLSAWHFLMICMKPLT